MAGIPARIEADVAGLSWGCFKRNGEKPGVFYGKAAVVVAPGPKRIRPQRSFESNCHVGYIGYNVK